MFSKRLVETISRLGLSRYKIAKDTKITEATLSNYCNGKVSPSPSIVKQLSDYLGVEYNWLMTGEGKSASGNSNVISDSTTTYRARKKKYVKNDLKSIIDFFESQLKTKDEVLTHNLEDIRNRLDSIEQKLDSFNKPVQTKKK